MSMSNRDKVALGFLILWLVIKLVGISVFGIEPTLMFIVMLGIFVVLFFIPSKLSKSFKNWLDKK